MQGADLNGRKINVELSKRTRPREPTPGIYCWKQVSTWVRRGHLLPEDHMAIVSLTLDRQVGLRRGTDIVIMRREDTETIVIVLVQNHPTTTTGDADPAIPGHLADDMYTSPTTA